VFGSWLFDAPTGLASPRVLYGGIAMSSAFCAVSMAVLLLLAEIRFAPERADRPIALRIALTVQLLLLLAWPGVTGMAIDFFQWGAFAYPSFSFGSTVYLGGLQVAIEAFLFATADLSPSRGVRLRQDASGHYPWLTVVFQSGGWGGIAFVLFHMGLLLAGTLSMRADVTSILALTAFCGYVCLFTGLPAYGLRLIAPRFSGPVLPRAGTLLLLLVFSILPTILAATTGLESNAFTFFLLLSPFAMTTYWWRTGIGLWTVLALSGVGLFVYFRLMRLGRRLNLQRGARPLPGGVRG
jgi:hypothetical protein